MKKIKKLVVLGIDGLDYRLTSKYLKLGRLANLAKLAGKGGFDRLGTTTPPQSPVAWASFVTGKKPEDHGVWDFLKRDPKSYLLYPTFSPVEKGSPIKTEPFWKKATKAGINNEVLFLPVTFPAEKIKGQMIAGMGTPDILGTEGTIFLLTTDESLIKGKRGRRVRLAKSGIVYKGEILGPRYKTYKGVEFSKLDVEVEIEGKKAVVRHGRERVEICEREFSGWVDFEFKIGVMKKIRGRAKWFLKSISPEIVLHLSPINIKPENQVFDISYPRSFAAELQKSYGKYDTLGLPHDSWALQEGIFSKADYLKQAGEIFRKRKEILLGQLSNFKQGLWVGYLGTLDSIQHMFWGEMGNQGKYKDIIPGYYEEMDKAVGEAMGMIDKETLMVVLSDHGFGSFDWEVNLNSWLKREGLMMLDKEEGDELYEGVNWENTQAFAAGFNSIYLNIRNREAKGSVDESERQDLSEKIKLMLERWTWRGERVIKHAYVRKDGDGGGENQGPDLVVGYSQGFRASWETAVGATPRAVIKKREGRWCGDHLFDASEVPGVLFSNEQSLLKVNNIWEIMPEVFEFFGVE